MENEQTTPSDTEGKKPDTIPPKNNESDSPFEKADKLNKEFKEENERREKIISEEKALAASALLAGTGGGHIVPDKEKVLSDEEYADKFMKGEVNPLKEDGISLD